MSRHIENHIRICKIHNQEKYQQKYSYKFVCKTCAIERSNKWRELNKERYKKQNKELYLKRKEKLSQNKLLGIKEYLERESEIICSVHNINKVYAADNGLICRACKKEYANEYRKRNPGKKYGLNAMEFHFLYEKANNKCEICFSDEIRKWNGIPGRLCIDHNHDETKKVRGILCTKCNAMLGLVNDDISILQSAINYLNSHQHQ